jgi:hypothetical protein
MCRRVCSANGRIFSISSRCLRVRRFVRTSKECQIVEAQYRQDLRRACLKEVGLQVVCVIRLTLSILKSCCAERDWIPVNIEKDDLMDSFPITPLALKCGEPLGFNRAIARKGVKNREFFVDVS